MAPRQEASSTSSFLGNEEEQRRINEILFQQMQEEIRFLRVECEKVKTFFHVAL